MQDAYELGKFAGDTAGFPRVGIVNKDLVLISDTFQYLTSYNPQVELLYSSNTNNVDGLKRKFQRKLNTPVKLKYIRTMFGNYALRVSVINSKLYRKFEKRVLKTISSKNKKELILFLAGLADAEVTIDTRNRVASYSFGIKNKKFCKECEKLLLYLQIPYRKRNLKKEIKLEILFDYFVPTIGEYIRHSDKKERLCGKLIQADETYIRLLNREKYLTSNLMAKKLDCNVDHARRILRMLYRMKIVNRKSRGTRFSPYIYYAE